MRKSFAPTSLYKKTQPTSLIYPNTSFQSTVPVKNWHVTDSACSQSSRRYEVVYAKKSTKKHKKWEDDGILIIRGASVILKNLDNKTVATGSFKKSISEALSVGSVASIGGYECELIKLIVTNIVESIKDLDNLVSKPANPAAISSLQKVGLKKLSSIHPSFTESDFFMPPPPQFHVWNYNTDNLPLTPVFVNGSLAKKLHSYQLEGIKFLYECICGFRRPIPVTEINFDALISSENSSSNAVNGAILADEMGLGKTVQVIGLVSMLLKQGPYGGRPVLRRCLIVTPGSLVQNWQKEFDKWVGFERISVYCVRQDQPVKAYLSQMRPPPIIIISYEMLLQHIDRVSSIANIDLIVCDEGHRLKNVGIKTRNALLQLTASKRIILTGTPVQNDLNEFWSLAEFCAPGCLAASRENYRQYIVNPLSKSKQSNDIAEASIAPEDYFLEKLKSSEIDEEIIAAAKRLRNALDKFMLRRTSDVVSRCVPEKEESIVFCRISDMQRELEHILIKWAHKELDVEVKAKPLVETFVNHFEDDSSTNEDSGQLLTVRKGAGILACIMALRKLYNHPSILYEFLKKHRTKNHESNLKNKNKSLNDELVEELWVSMHYLTPLFSGESTHFLPKYSGKLSVLLSMLKRLFPTEEDNSEDSGKLENHHRLVLVSNFTQTLDMLEPLCAQHTKSPCLRIDGKTPTKQRLQLVDKFNSLNSVEKVLLLSSKAGGTGLNLIGADYLILFDMDWNPATDAQAMARVWREGQKRPVHLYRLVTAGGLEERIFQRQVAKSDMAGRVTDECSRIFKSNILCYETNNFNSTGRLTRDELRELFCPAPPNSICWTHDLLGCSCHLSVGRFQLQSSISSPTGSPVNSHHGDYAIPKVFDTYLDDSDNADDRICQLGPTIKKAKWNLIKSSSDQQKINISSSLANIKQWKHHIFPSLIDSLDDFLLLQPNPNLSQISAVFTCFAK